MAQAGGFQVLDASEPAGRTQWLALWDAWPLREVFAHPGYAELFTRADERAICVTWDGPRGEPCSP